METIVSIVGGVGLFLLGMAVMTDGLKALAGTALKQVMERAAATPLLGHVLGRGHNAARAIVERHHHDHHRAGQRWAPDLPARLEPGLRRQYRHNRDRLAGGGVWGPNLADRRRAADRLRRRAAQGGRTRTAGGGGKRNRRFRSDPGRVVDASGRDGRPRRALHPSDLPTITNEAGVVTWRASPTCCC